MAGYKLPHHKHMSMNELKSFLNPKDIYLEQGNSKLSVGDYVYKYQTIGHKERFNVPIISSVSGTVVDIKDGYIKIKNDLLEKTEKEIINRDVSKIKKEEFLDIIEKAGIIGMGGAGFPTHMKYKTDKNIELLIVNAVECEPYITADYSIMNEKCNELLEGINNIIRINKINNAILAIKKTNVEVIKKFKEIIDKYPKIELRIVRDIYPMGWERTLIKEVTKKEYDILPIELGIVVNNISTIFAINNALKHDIPLVERIITITGENVKNPGNVMVKIGTSVNEILKFMGGIHDDSVLISGGPMMGVEINKTEYIKPQMNCILVLPKPKEENIINCLRCGKCVSACPANLAPVLIKECSNKEELIKLQVNKCISCGLCSYICPSRIDLRNIVNEKKEVIK
ncbi:MAG: RnfABCDGE type electron transport complex subunit C [Bacilli bacterium]|nr:RnfABCDGE type electron transport complex subunit C [Bacilli bacterium]